MSLLCFVGRERVVAILLEKRNDGGFAGNAGEEKDASDAEST